MSQKKDSSLSNLEKLQTKLIGSCDTLFSLARKNGYTHVACFGNGEEISGMIARELCHGDHKEPFGALITAAIYLACLNNDEFFVKFDELYNEMQQQRVENRHGQDAN